jgi:hypothetical protein
VAEKVRRRVEPRGHVEHGERGAVGGGHEGVDLEVAGGVRRVAVVGWQWVRCVYYINAVILIGDKLGIKNILTACVWRAGVKGEWNEEKKERKKKKRGVGCGWDGDARAVLAGCGKSRPPK